MVKVAVTVVFFVEVETMKDVVVAVVEVGMTKTVSVSVVKVDVAYLSVVLKAGEYVTVLLLC